MVGIEAEGPDGLVNIRARKAVILATGGFKSNSQMIRAWHPHFDEDLLWSGWPMVNNTGDGHLLAMDIGAGMVDTSFICNFSEPLDNRYHIRWDKPYFDNPSTNTGLPARHLDRTIFVENEAHRYFNESVWEAGHTLAWKEHILAFLAVKGRPRQVWLVNGPRTGPTKPDGRLSSMTSRIRIPRFLLAWSRDG